MEQIIGLLREVDVKISQGKSVVHICREAGITEQTYYKWRKEYGGMKTFQVKRLKDLEKEIENLFFKLFGFKVNERNTFLMLI